MQSAKTAQADPAAGVEPAPQPRAPWRVTAVRPLPNLCLSVTFVDGTSGEVRLRGLLESPKVKGTPFESLRDPEFFRRVRVALGAVTWPNGADLAPDAMYDAILARGSWDAAP